MDYTADQQFQLELENTRYANMASMEIKRARLESLRLAKEILAENARNKPMGEGEVSAEDIIAFADKLFAHLDA